MKFVEDCVNYYLVKEFQFFLRFLEVIKIIRVENLSFGVDDDSLKNLFGNFYNGGGRVVNIEYFFEESFVLIEFFDKRGNIFQFDFVNFIWYNLNYILVDFNFYQLNFDVFNFFVYIFNCKFNQLFCLFGIYV